jgi:hypothetical protein
LLNLKSIENLSDLNNIPKLCPSITLIFLMLLGGVAERWVNIGLFFFKENYMTTQVIMVTWVTKKKGL